MNKVDENILDYMCRAEDIIIAYQQKTLNKHLDNYDFIKVSIEIAKIISEEEHYKNLKKG